MPPGWSRNSRYGNPKFPAQAARDIPACAACSSYGQHGSLKALRFHRCQELFVPRLDPAYLADATRRQFLLQKAI
jgi:hypothetical protein